MVNARPAANLNNRCYELDASVIAAIKVELCTLQRAAGPRGLRGPRPRLSLPLRSTGHQWDARPKTQFRRRLAAGGRRIRTLGPRSAATPLSDRKSLLYPSSSPKAGLVLRTEGLDRFAARSWLLLGVCPCKSMLRRKPLAGAKSFPAVRHEPTNPDEGLARAGAADRQGVPLLGGEQPVGCALLCRNSLRQLLAALTILRARPQGYGR